MTGYGPISLLFGAILGIAYLAIQMNMMSTVSDAINMQSEPFEYRNETVDAAAAVAAQKSYEILDMEGRPTSVKRAAPLLAPTRFSDGRSARFATHVDPARLLKEGETMPEGEMQALMVEARAARLADAACVRLRETLAAECGVRSFQAERIGPAEEWMDEERVRRHLPFVGQFLLTTTMVFTPKAPVGDLPESARVTLNEKTFKLDPWTTEAPSPHGVAARTGEVMMAAVRACADIRAIHGNCTVIGVDLGGNRREAGAFSGAFELAWLTPVQGAVPPEAGEATPAAPAAPTASELVPAPAAPADTPVAAVPAEPGAPAAAPAAPNKGGKAGKWVSP